MNESEKKNRESKEIHGRQSESSKKKVKIFAYGFDKIGFQNLDMISTITKNSEIKFISMRNSILLDSADGVIIPSGIFENITYLEDRPYGYLFSLGCDNDFLLKKEKEVFNLLKNGGWICFLISKICDNLLRNPEDLCSEMDCHDTDLSKKFMNRLSISREPFKGSASVSSKNDEFNNYIERWGIAKTKLDFSSKNKDRKILAVINNSVVGVEFNGSIFFLPFNIINHDENEAKLLVEELSRSILGYLQKRILEIPEWTNEFAFIKEKKLENDLKKTKSKEKKISDELSKFKSYKGIISQSGEALKDTVVLILKDFFSLNITDVEDFKEDALIRDFNNGVLISLEIKGTNKGIKREYINQIDSNRERRGLASTTPGLLIINDQMKINDVSNRFETTVAPEQTKHAKNMNILIIRTIDLLFFMRTLEKKPDRGKIFISYCFKGGGRLYIDGESQLKIDKGE